MPSIPLYLVTGPSLEVSTDNEITTSYLNGALLGHGNGESQEPWWLRSKHQSDHGILLKVEDGGARRNLGIQLTELLLYAAVEFADGPSSPHRALSSSETLGQPPQEPLEESEGSWKLYALPLCSNIITLARQASGLCTPPPEGSTYHETPRFLPDLSATDPLPQKRQKMSALFEDATQQRRRLKRRGGEGVSKTMANMDAPLSWQGALKNNNDMEGPAVASGKTPAARPTFTRVPSIASVAGVDLTRPPSRGALANGKRSSLHRVESAFSPRETSVVSDSDNSYSQQNKTALTKVVMAGMRLHGLQQRKRPGKTQMKSAPCQPLTSNPASELSQDKDDDFKLIYHQTFKATVFAFRSHFAARVIGQETMRDVVDRLLSIFCPDPLPKDGHGGDVRQSFDLHQPETSNEFDLPSLSVPVKMIVQE